MTLCKTIITLKKYFQMYWLKPFDAVNDTANASALLEFDWKQKPILEIGGGDGVFSFIMHGGAFNFLNDRYDQIDLTNKDDIYDTRNRTSLKICKNAVLKYNLGIDMKLSHLLKSRETHLYKNLASALPEALPLRDSSFATIFLYTFHGLTDYNKTLQEIRRVIKTDGKLLILIVNSKVKDSFLCYKLHLLFKKIGFNKLSIYFLGLDGGRYKEIGETFSKKLSEWRDLLNKSGFQIDKTYSQVTPLLWKIYDTQTRPVLKPMIRLNTWLNKVYLKPIVKFLWVYFWLPIISISYFILAKPKEIKLNDNCNKVFLTMMATPI